MSEQNSSSSDEKQCESFGNLPDVTKYSPREQEELLRRLLTHHKPTKHTLPSVSHALVANPSQMEIHSNDYYFIPLYPSKNIIQWYLLACTAVFLLSSYNYICMTYHKTVYCKDPKLDDPGSWLLFCLTFIITGFYLGKMTHSTYTCYRRMKQALHNTNNTFIKGSDHNDFELQHTFTKIAKWIFGFYLLSLILLFTLYYFILLFATYRDIHGVPGFIIFLNPQSLIFLTHSSIGIFVFIIVYFPILSFILCLILYQQLCNMLYHISVTYSLSHMHNTMHYQHKLMEVRFKLCDLKLFLMYIPPIFGVIVLLWNAEFWLLMNLSFGRWDNGTYIWSIVSSVVSSCSVVLYGLSRNKLSNYFGRIFQICLSRKVLPVSTAILPLDRYHAINSAGASASSQQTKWRKMMKWCINIHSVITIMVCIALLNYVIQPSEYKASASARWVFSTVITATILISTGYLMSQLCSKDVHYRIIVLYKSWLLIIKIVFIRRCKYIIDNGHAAQSDVFVVFEYIFTVLSAFGLVIFMMITTRSELLPVNNSVETKLIFKNLFPGCVGVDKWILFRWSFCLSMVMVFVTVVWCIAFANTSNDKIFTVEFLYIFVWIVPQLCWHNEIVQYIGLHLEWNASSDMDSKLNDKFTISLSTLQLIQPIVIISCILSFVYLSSFCSHLGYIPTIFCGVQLFINSPISIVSLWQS
eukprot:151322_1